MDFISGFSGRVSTAGRSNPSKITPVLPLQPPPEHPAMLDQCLPSSLFSLHLPPASCFSLTLALAFIMYLSWQLSVLQRFPPPPYPVLYCTALEASLLFTCAAIATAGDAPTRPSWPEPSACDPYLRQVGLAPSR